MTNMRAARVMGCSVLAIMAAGAVQAQDIYGGVGVGYLAFDSGGGANALDAMLGVRWASGNLAFGAEADYLATMGLSDDIVRLRGVVSTDLGNVTLFGAAGGMWAVTSTYNGYSIGVGAEIPLNNNASVRIQADRNIDTAGIITSTDVLVGVEINF